MSNGAKFNRKSKITLRSKSANLTGYMAGTRVGQKLSYGANKLKDFVIEIAKDKLEDYKNGTLDLSTANPELRHAILERLKKISK